MRKNCEVSFPVQSIIPWLKGCVDFFVWITKTLCCSKKKKIQLNVWWVSKCKQIENGMKHFLQLRRETGKPEHPHFET